MTLRVEPLADRRAIDAILTHPDIARKLRRDDYEPGYIDHPLIKYYGAWRDEELVGVFLAIAFTQYETEVHVAILPCAIRDSRALCRLFLGQVFADPQVMRATAHITGHLRSAVNLCLRLGFTLEGERRNACLVNGTPTSVVTLGLLKEEFAASRA